MSVTLTYDAVLSRVRVSANGLSTTADYATVERSTDQIRWKTVRGGAQVLVSAGAFVAPVDDYEFAPDVTNYYRVRDVRTDPIAFVAAGAASTGSSGSRTPGAPASLENGDLVLISASTRNSGTGTVNTPTGTPTVWSPVGTSGNFSIFSGRWAGGGMPTVTYTGGAANEDTIAQAAAWRNASAVPAIGAVAQLNASAQNIAHGAMNVDDDGLLLVGAGWKQDDLTSVDPLDDPVLWTEIQEASSTAGNDASQVWDYLIQTTGADVVASTFAVTGGAAAISRSILLAFAHADYITEQTANITPDLDAIWVKSVMRSFLNRAWSVLWPSGDDVVRPGRGVDYEVASRTLPIAVTELGGSRRFPLIVRTESAEETRWLDYVIASGDVLFLHAPADCPVPSMYARMDTANIRRVRPTGSKWITTVPLVEVAAPGPDIVTASATWATIFATYGSFAELLADYATFTELLELVGDPSEVIVE